MLSDFAIVRPMAPPLYGANESATTQHGSDDKKSKNITQHSSLASLRPLQTTSVGALRLAISRSGGNGRGAPIENRQRSR